MQIFDDFTVGRVARGGGRGVACHFYIDHVQGLLLPDLQKEVAFSQHVVTGSSFRIKGGGLSSCMFHPLFSSYPSQVVLYQQAN